MRNPIDADPHPKVAWTNPPAVRWPVTRTISCPPVAPPPERSFSRVIEGRRSTRRLDRLPLRMVTNLVGYIAAPRQIKVGGGTDHSRRITPSAGAIHAIELLIVDLRRTARAFRYDAWQHKLELLISQRPKLEDFKASVLDVLAEAKGTAIVFAGDFDRVSSRYENPQSLFWRDAGALLQTIQLVATAYDIGVCPLGILGHHVVQAIGLEQRLVACGVVIVGRSFGGIRNY